jgi:hypothetical protein
MSTRYSDRERAYEEQPMFSTELVARNENPAAAHAAAAAHLAAPRAAGGRGALLARCLVVGAIFALGALVGMLASRSEPPAASAGDEPPAGGAGAGGSTSRAVGAVALVITLDADIATIGAWGSDTYATFVASFATDMAAALGVAPHRVAVNGVAAGSVVVDFIVSPDASGTPIAAAVITAAFSAQGISIAGAKTETTIAASDITAVPTCGCSDSFDYFERATCEVASCCWDHGVCSDLPGKPAAETETEPEAQSPAPAPTPTQDLLDWDDSWGSLASSVEIAAGNCYTCFESSCYTQERCCDPPDGDAACWAGGRLSYASCCPPESEPEPSTSGGCASAPCQHDGACESIDTGPAGAEESLLEFSYACHCTAGHGGDDCEDDLSTAADDQRSHDTDTDWCHHPPPSRFRPPGNCSWGPRNMYCRRSLWKISPGPG